MWTPQDRKYTSPPQVMRRRRCRRAWSLFKPSARKSVVAPEEERRCGARRAGRWPARRGADSLPGGLSAAVARLLSAAEADGSLCWLQPDELKQNPSRSRLRAASGPTPLVGLQPFADCLGVCRWARSRARRGAASCFTLPVWRYGRPVVTAPGKYAAWCDLLWEGEEQVCVPQWISE